MSIDISTLNKIDGKPKVRLSVKNSFALNKEINISFTNRNKFKARFFQELSVLISSGLDIGASLSIIEKGFKKKKEKEDVERIKSFLIGGGTLSEALEDNEKCFSPFDYHSIKIGEESGKLDDSTKELSLFYENKIKQSKNLKGALSYPILVLITTVLSLGFMITFIVPMFEDVFRRFQGELPALTKGIIRFSDFAKSYSIYIFLIIILFLVLIYVFRNNTSFRRYSSRVILKLPIISSIILLEYKARYCQSLRLLCASEVPLMESIVLIGKMIGFYPFEKATKEISEQLKDGSTLSKAMSQHSVFDSRMVSLTEVAEEVNNLELVYSQLHSQYSSELDSKIKTLNSLLEPILIIGVGAIVAIMLISMYLPIFQIGMGLS